MSDTATAPALQRRRVPLGDLKIDFPGWKNPRSFTGLDEDALDALGDNIKTHGIEVPPHVARVKHKGGEVNLVIDGQRRVLAAGRVLKPDHLIEVIDVEAEAVDLTPVKVADLTGRALNIGNNRAGLHSYELCEAAHELRQRGVTIAKIAMVIGKSDTWVSKMLKARDAAKDSLMIAWKKGEIPDEMFKEIAALDHDKQQAALNSARAARDAGDKAGARHAVKETVELEKRAKANGHARTENDDGGNDKSFSRAKGPAPEAKPTKPQQDMFAGKDKDEPKKEPPKPQAPGRAILEDMVAMADKHPPTDEYVKGLMDGVRYALGFTNPAKFANPWVVYLARVEGRVVSNPRNARASLAKKDRAKKAKRAKARKAAKKSKRSRR